jgi:hypothetical protein
MGVLYRFSTAVSSGFGHCVVSRCDRLPCRRAREFTEASSFV